ncbi:hypothetical protein CEUSTIGMA_g11873.t1 [Chlamydomonas eustigma]|uniref:Cyclic nucleotide-binding domain-containing protein n=1 Tax=Chlamydomonas eustigma TaxID=1157962 RepID=A0A250XN76_9CHLO|nr:hypothetical protein CEUSTIGMA_g11873.t1 [Chlamydomonas eustigma]|eukprot:GAX84453.1 hypothetical protein CEUSTIGMA_g11873.t1 [Chlamydomonas eustigma]
MWLNSTATVLSSFYDKMYVVQEAKRMVDVDLTQGSDSPLNSSTPDIAVNYNLKYNELKKERRSSAVSFGDEDEESPYNFDLEFGSRKAPGNAIYGNAPVTSIKEKRKSKVFVDQDIPTGRIAHEAESGTARWWMLFKPRVISPKSKWYKIFWYITMVVALINAVLSPYQLAFVDEIGYIPCCNFWAGFDMFCTTLFLADIILKFFRAYVDSESKEVVSSIPKISIHYLKFLFWFDVIFMIPFVSIILSADPNMPPLTAMYVGLLGFLKVGRLYRIFDLFYQLDHDMILSQIALMLLRNFFYLLMTAHWFACLIFLIARVENYQHGFGNGDVSMTGFLALVENSTASRGSGIGPPPCSWVMRHIERFDGQPVSNYYIYSLYFSIVEATLLGDNDFYSASPAESIAISMYLLFSVVFGAYILGTVNMLMVKGDQRSADFRDKKCSLTEYSGLHDLPEDLEKSMHQHLELSYQSEMSSDERVLAIYPPAIRRRVLRHLYLQPLRHCYLFKRCKPKVLDSILAVSRTELFMPNVQLISEGDIVQDLSIVIEGEVQIIPASSEGSSALSTASRRRYGNENERGTGRSSTHRRSSNLSVEDGAESIRDRRRSSALSYSSSHSNASLDKLRPDVGMIGMDDIRGTSDCFGEVAFFSDLPSTDTVWTNTVVRVLIVPKSAYETMTVTYPSQVRLILTNLRDNTEKGLLDNIQDALDMVLRTERSIHVRLEPYMTSDVLRTTKLEPDIMQELRGLLSSEVNKTLDRMQLIDSAVTAFCSKQDVLSFFELITASGNGNEEVVKTLLAQGLPVDGTDYDQRTCLHVAAKEGHVDIVKMLLQAGADVFAEDAFGTTPLYGAVKRGFDEVVDILLSYGASLNGCEPALMDMVDSITERKMTVLQRYLRAEADVNGALLDTRTLLHVAAAECNLEAVKMLVDAGANVLTCDRWNNSAIDDAKNIRAHAVVQYLEPLVNVAQDTLKQGAAIRALTRNTSLERSGSLQKVGIVKKKFEGGSFRVRSSFTELPSIQERSETLPGTPLIAGSSPHATLQSSSKEQHIGLHDYLVQATMSSELRAAPVLRQAIIVEEERQEDTNTVTLLQPEAPSPAPRLHQVTGLHHVDKGVRDVGQTFGGEVADVEALVLPEDATAVGNINLHDDAQAGMKVFHMAVKAAQTSPDNTRLTSTLEVPMKTEGEACPENEDGEFGDSMVQACDKTRSLSSYMGRN